MKTTMVGAHSVIPAERGFRRNDDTRIGQEVGLFCVEATRRSSG